MDHMDKLKELATDVETAAVEKITLDDGRIVTMREPNAVYYTKCVEMSNGTQMLIPFYEAMFCVVKIDDAIIAPPSTRLKMDALSQKIGRRGLDLVTAWFQRKIYPELTEVQEEAEAGQLTQEEVQALVETKRSERLKKSLGTP